MNLLEQSIQLMPTQMNQILEAAKKINGTVSVYHVYSEDPENLEIQVQINFDRTVKLDEFTTAIGEANPEYTSIKVEHGEFLINDGKRISMIGGYGPEGCDDGQRDVMSFCLSNSINYI